MPMEIKWTDCDGDEIVLTAYTHDGALSERGVLYLCDPDSDPEDALFAFTPEDAESFADALRSWALRQREGK